MKDIVHLSIITSLGSYFPLSKSLDDLTMYKKNYTHNHVRLMPACKAGLIFKTQLIQSVTTAN